MNQSQGRGLRAEARIAEVSAAQHGVFSREQAELADFSRRMINQRVAQQRWIAVDYGVYRARTTVSTWNLVVSAACLAGPAAASFRAGARLWRYPGFEFAMPEVTAFRHRRRHGDAVIWHESRFLTEGRDTTVLEGIPVTSATRTIIDLSTVASVQQIEIALDNACHRGLTDAARVGAELERMGRVFGTERIRSVLDLKLPGDAPAESPLESRFAMIIRSTTLPSPTPQFEVFAQDRFVGRVDFAWPEFKVAVEVDGFSVHGNRAAWDRDQLRSTKLSAAGWRVLHITHDRMNDPVGMIDDLRRTLVRISATK